MDIKWPTPFIYFRIKVRIFKYITNMLWTKKCYKMIRIIYGSDNKIYIGINIGDEDGGDVYLFDTIVKE